MCISQVNTASQIIIYAKWYILDPQKPIKYSLGLAFQLKR